MKWMDDPTGPGFYYWQSPTMNTNHIIVVYVSEYKYPEIAPGKFHVGMMLPVNGLGYYNYKHEGPIEKMPAGQFWGPLPIPEDAIP